MHPQTEPNKIDILTFYRFLAASIVVLFHYGRNTALVSFAPGFLTAGPEMVSFFFVLSGFVMVVAYMDRPFDPPGYYHARLVRILPTYYLALLASLFLETVAYTKKAAVFNALFLQAWIPPYPMSINGPSWSLSVEMFFYLTFPLVLWFLKPRKIGTVRLLLGAGAVWLLTLAALTGFMNSPFYEPYPSVPNDLVFFFPLSHFATFLFGVAGGYFYLDRQRSLPWKAGWLRLGVMITALAIIAALNNKPAIVGLLHISVPFAAGFFAPLFLALVLLTAFLNRASAKGVPAGKGLVLLGDASYALYIFQRPLHQFFDAFVFPLLGLSGEAAFYVYFFCLVLFSIAVFLFVEKPVKRLFAAGRTRYRFAKQS